MVRNLAKLEVDFSKSDRNIFRKSQQVFLLGNRKYKHRPQLPVAGKLKELKLEKGHFQNTVTEVPEHPTLPFSSLLKNCRVLKRKNFVFYTIISNSVYVLISEGCVLGHAFSRRASVSSRPLWATYSHKMYTKVVGLWSSLAKLNSPSI